MPKIKTTGKRPAAATQKFTSQAIVVDDDEKTIEHMEVEDDNGEAGSTTVDSQSTAAFGSPRRKPNKPSTLSQSKPKVHATPSK